MVMLPIAGLWRVYCISLAMGTALMQENKCVQPSPYHLMQGRGPHRVGVWLAVVVHAASGSGLWAQLIASFVCGAGGRAGGGGGGAIYFLLLFGTSGDKLLFLSNRLGKDSALTPNGKRINVTTVFTNATGLATWDTALGQVVALRGHCVRTACILRTQRLGYSPKNTCHLTSCTVKQQSPHENGETAFNLVLHRPYEQTTQPCKVRLLRVFRCPWLRSWRRR